MKIQYRPSEDELVFLNRPVTGGPNKEVDHLKIWWDDEGTICAVVIKGYFDMREEFQKSLHVIQLGGIWKGIIITDEDIKESRKELLRILEENW